MTQKSVNKITFYNILSTVLLQGISLFTAPYFSRVLGNSNYGVVSIYTTWATLLSTVFGLQTQSTIAVSKNEFQEKRILDTSPVFSSCPFCPMQRFQQ